MQKKAPNKEKHVLTDMPPQAVDTEVAVLGSMLMHKEAANTAVELLSANSFYRDAHRKIFQAALALYEHNEPIDVITVSDELEKRAQLNAVGGLGYLSELVKRTVSAANIEYYCKIVRDKALLRNLITVSTEIQQDCFEASQEAADIIDLAEQKIFSISEQHARRDYSHISPVLTETLEKIQKFGQNKEGLTGVSTGFHRLDEMLSGLQPSDLVVLAARPSMGKTALAINIGRNAAMKGTPVAMFSLEMANYQLVMRMLCSEARVDSHRARIGRLKDEEWARLSKYAGVLAEMPFYIDDTPGISVLELRSKARRLKVEHNVGLIIVDYLQLLRLSTRAESRQIEIAMISQSLKNLAKELDTPVLSLSQLSRAVESRGGDGKPMLSDLRESGAIEQDADVVMFINRPAAYGREVEPELQNVAEVIIAKQRNGPVGEVELVFLSEFIQFANKEEYRDVPETQTLSQEPF
ncbi:MAG: replicative DNA helicase [candidate division KSB1 bacterium]|nr:replicative DNA helicase [candidate division KSB1 bacterium]